jgi:hypothetical protein
MWRKKQKAHAACACGENEPTPHDRHATIPVVGATVLRGHLVHAARLLPRPSEPRSHGKHDTPAESIFGVSTNTHTNGNR